MCVRGRLQSWSKICRLPSIFVAERQRVDLFPQTACPALIKVTKILRDARPGTRALAQIVVTSPMIRQLLQHGYQLLRVCSHSADGICSPISGRCPMSSLLGGIPLGFKSGVRRAFFVQRAAGLVLVPALETNGCLAPTANFHVTFAEIAGAFGTLLVRFTPTA